MDRDPRERERGAARRDVASLWIDFLLLPEKLEEHLAAGHAAVPSPPDLISMFLEQALVNHKSLSGNNSTANGVNKDAEPQGAVKTTSRTASLLCERAARVAVVIRLTLADIESSIPSPLHQFVLLKSLIRHDKRRSLLHQCNLHRWLIHKVLQSHPVGSASPNFVLPANRLGAWIAGDDLGEVFHGVVNGGGDPPVSTTGDSRSEEERASVEFLERILDEDIKEEDSTMSCTDSNSQKEALNGGSDTEQGLSTAYKCQVIHDVAEVHFMRGRIRRAHELFSKCGEILNSLSVREYSSPGETGLSTPEALESEPSHAGTSPGVSPVPQDRLAGFLVACKMLLRTSADGNGGDTIRSVKSAGSAEPSYVGAPSPTQWAVISCEQSRWAARRYGSKVTSQSALANGDSGYSDFSSGKEMVEASLSGRTSTDMLGRTLEDSSAHHVSSRSKKRTLLENANGDMIQNESQLEKEESLSCDTIKRVKDSGHMETIVDKIDSDEHHLSNGGEGRSHERKDEVNSDRQIAKDANTNTIVPIVGEKLFQMGVDIVKNEPTTTFNGGGYGPEVDLFVDLKGDPGDDMFTKLISDMKYSSTTVPEKRLIQAFVEDILRGHLSSGYCLAVEKDPLLSKPVRSRLAACNVVRSVLEGAPVESFLRTRAYFEGCEDSVEFLMQLLLAIKAMQEGNRLSLGRTPRGMDSRQNARLVKLGFLIQSVAGVGAGAGVGASAKKNDVSPVIRRVHDLAMYACCVIDKPWCWGYSVKLGLVGEADLPRFSGQLPQNTLKDVEGSGIFLKAEAQPDLQTSLVPRPDELISERDILLSFAQVESLHEVEVLVEKVKSMTEKARKKKVALVDDSLQRLGDSKLDCEHFQSPVQSDLVNLTGSHSPIPSSSLLASSKSQTCLKRQSSSMSLDGDQCSSLGADVCAILQRRAFSALETMKDPLVAKRLYELALTIQPRDYDSAMMLWLLDSCAEFDAQVLSKGTRDLPSKCEGDILPSSALLDFVILQLIEKELWDNLCELCKWAVSLIIKEPVVRDGEQGKNAEKEAIMCPPKAGGTVENAAMKSTAGWQLRQKRLLQTLNVARTVVDLMPLCGSLQTAVSRNHFNEDVARLGSTLSQLFEDFLCFLVGIESEGNIRGTDDAATQWGSGTQVGLGAPHHLSSAGVSLISKVTNPRVLMALASLTAGWLQRCHVVLLTPWPLAVERYGVLAGVTAGASLPPPVGPLPYPAAVLRPVPPRVSPDFGRDLFCVLLEGIVGLPGVVEGDREKGHRWLQGLADLAFEDEAYVKALRLYLQAGAIRSAQYCDRASSMNRDIFTPWVIQRMVAACRSVGAGIQAAVLCQCLPVPDHELAFRILQENSLIMDRDAAAYFECIWEVPILELLVHLHSRAGDEERVTQLIALLQQPALNVHNPSAIRQAHISTMEQRFLQRLAAELL
ncbi:unnamed protein product [Calypogeia fissa]